MRDEVQRWAHDRIVSLERDRAIAVAALRHIAAARWMGGRHIESAWANEALDQLGETSTHDIVRS